MENVLSADRKIFVADLASFDIKHGYFNKVLMASRGAELRKIKRRSGNGRKLQHRFQWRRSNYTVFNNITRFIIGPSWLCELKIGTCPSLIGVSEL